MPHTFFLVPGYGAQGGTARDVAGMFDDAGSGAIVNSSRGIIGAWRKDRRVQRDDERRIRARPGGRRRTQRRHRHARRPARRHAVTNIRPPASIRKNTSNTDKESPCPAQRSCRPSPEATAAGLLPRPPHGRGHRSDGTDARRRTVHVPRPVHRRARQAGAVVNLFSHDPMKLLPRPFGVSEVSGDLVSLIFAVVGTGTAESPRCAPGTRSTCSDRSAAPSRSRSRHTTCSSAAVSACRRSSTRRSGSRSATTVRSLPCSVYRDAHFADEFVSRYVDTRSIDETEGNVVTLLDRMEAELTAPREDGLKTVFLTCGPTPMMKAVALWASSAASSARRAWSSAWLRVRHLRGLRGRHGGRPQEGVFGRPGVHRAAAGMGGVTMDETTTTTTTEQQMNDSHINVYEPHEWKHKTVVAGVEWKNPVGTASGTFQLAACRWFYDVAQMGAICTKGGGASRRCRGRATPAAHRGMPGRHGQRGRPAEPRRGPLSGR